jgi:hypothetical protein
MRPFVDDRVTLWKILSTSEIEGSTFRIRATDPRNCIATVAQVQIPLSDPNGWICVVQAKRSNEV